MSIVYTGKTPTEANADLEALRGGLPTGVLQPTLRQYLTDQAKVSIRDFGAAVDGVTDDTVAWQKAFDRVVLLGGGTATMPIGTSICDQATIAAAVHVVIEGFGSGASRILAKAAGRTTGAMISSIGGSLEFRSITLDGNGPNQAPFPSTLDIVQFDGTEGSFIMENDVVITRNKSDGVHGFHIENDFRVSAIVVDAGQPGGTGNTAVVFFVESGYNGRLLFHNITATNQPIPTVQTRGPCLIQIAGSTSGAGAVHGGVGASIVATTNALSLGGGGGGVFAPTDVGTFIRVVGAGLAGADLLTTIATFVNATHVTLTDNALTSVAGVEATWAVNAEFVSEIRDIKIKNYGNHDNQSGAIDVYQYTNRLQIHHITGSNGYYSAVKAANSPYTTISDVAWDGQAYDTGSAAVFFSGNARFPAIVSDDVLLQNIAIVNWTHQHAITVVSGPEISKRAILDNCRAINCGGLAVIDSYKDVTFLNPISEGSLGATSDLPAIKLLRLTGRVVFRGGILQNGRGYAIEGDTGLGAVDIVVDGTLFKNNNLAAVGANHIFIDAGVGATSTLALINPEFSGTPTSSPAEVFVQNFAVADLVFGKAASTANMAIGATLVRRFGGTYNLLQVSAAYGSGAIGNAAQVAFLVTVTGATFGDFVDVSLSAANGNIQASGFVSLANTVTVVVKNDSGGSVTPTGNVNVRVMKL